MIWEHTWPEPQVIEAATYEDFLDSECIDVIFLRLAGPLPAFLQEDFGIRLLEDAPLEACPTPMALWVCHESRQHTLSQYRSMEHAEAAVGSFYFNPSRDILWFSIDFIDEDNNLRDLERYYEGQLDSFKTVLVEEEEWSNSTPVEYIETYLAPLRGIETIQLVYGDCEDDTDDILDIEDEELHSRADEYRAQYAEFLGHQECATKSIRYMDRSGRIY
jgi:2EXR family